MIRTAGNTGVVLLAAVLAAGCGRSNHYEPPPPPSVTVSKPLRMPITDYLNATGTVAAAQTVDLVARVEGYLRSIDFVDGSPVKKGQLLFVIQPEPYQANLAAAQAQLDNAQSEYQRQLRMIKENATSQANVEKWRSSRDQAAAQVEIARIQLGYTRITSPFDGRIDRHLIDVGNLVGMSGQATKLASVEQLDPVYVYFTVNERDLLKVRSSAAAAGNPINGKVPPVPVTVGLQTESGYPHQGTLDFASNSLDTGSGTLQLRAIVPNARFILLPGLFARVRVPLSKAIEQWVVPDRAVTTDQVGSYVLTVAPDHKVSQTRIEIGPAQNGMRVVLAGLAPESEVVTDGLQFAVPGNLVAPTEKPLALPPADGPAK
ncbi:MAG TPA: efflux RND transporter periplasmic adaptor subunit [Steroidobacteraceae bacterium]|nr:efflux RND transporter periplasmic adaptor subunit [Steroidobacteraceae bacterium]